MAGNLSTGTSARDALAAQIRAQYGGSGSGSGNWDDAGYDRAAELADLLLNAGVTDLGELSFVDSTIEGQYQSKLLKDVQGVRTEYEPSVDQEGTVSYKPVYYDANGKKLNVWGSEGGELWTEGDPVKGRKLKIGDKEVGYLGDYNNDGTFGDKASSYLSTKGWDSDQEENLLGWSARGKGNTGYHVITDPETGKLVISPNWSSSSDAAKARKAAIAAAIMVGGAYGISALAGSGAASGAGVNLGAGGATAGDFGMIVGADGAVTYGGIGAAEAAGAAAAAGGGATAAGGGAGGGLWDKVLGAVKGKVMEWGLKDYMDLAKLGLTAYGMYDMATDEGPDMTQANKLVDEQIQLGRDTLQFNRDMYADAKERQVGIDEVNKNAILTSTNLGREAGDRAKDSWDFYLREGRPMVQSTFADAKGWDSEASLDKVTGQAKSTVEQNFADLQQQNTRALARMGVNPNSGRFATLNNQIAMQKALGASGAMNEARDNRKTQAVGLRQQASNLAQGFPAQSMNFGNQSMQGANSAANVAGVGGTQNNAIGANAMSGMAMGSNIFGNAAQQASANATTAYGAQQANQQGWGNMMGYMWGSKMADGGKVQGPGTGTSDSVPAVNSDTGQRVQLSNGEFVVPSDVVKALGTKYFESLVAKHHKPVNLGRQS